MSDAPAGQQSGNAGAENRAETQTKARHSTAFAEVLVGLIRGRSSLA